MGDYLIGRGKMRVGKRGADGFPLAMVDVGEIPSIELVTNTTYANNFYTGGAFARQDLHVPTRVGMQINTRMKEKTIANLVRFFGGESVAIPATPVSDLAWPTGIAAGEERLLPDLAINVGTFSIKDSAGSPLTLTPGTHYTVDLKAGIVKFLATPGTQPYKASYTPVVGTSIPLLTVPGEAFFVDIDLIDISKQPNQRFKIQAYKAVFDQPQNIALKGDEVAEFPITLQCLDDETRTETAGLPFGRYGRWYPIG